MADKKNGPKGAAAIDAAGKTKHSNGGVASAKAAAGGMTKMDAVKKAMEKLGPDAMPVAIKDHLKKQYGIEISADVVSNYKKQLKTKADGAPSATTSADKPAASAVPVATLPQTAASVANGTKAAGATEPTPARGEATASAAAGEAAGQGKKPKITSSSASGSWPGICSW